MKKKKPTNQIDNSRLVRNVVKAQKGNHKALETIVNDTKNYIYYYCLSLLQNEDKAAEAVQDIYIILFKKLDTIKNPKSFLGWIKVVTGNYCQNQLARSRNDVSFEDDLDCKDEQNYPQLTPDKAVEANEMCKAVNSAVENLPLYQKECILMYYYQEMNISQIAAALGIKEGTVKSRLFNARKKLKSDLEKNGAEKYVLNGISPMSYIAYTLFNNANKTKIDAPIKLTAVAPVGKVDSSALLIYAVSTIPVAAKSAIALKIAVLAMASTMVAGSIIIHSVSSNLPAKSVSEKAEETQISNSNSGYNITENITELTPKEQAVEWAINGIEEKVRTEKNVKGINENTNYIKGKEITKNIDFHSLPSVVKYFDGETSEWKSESENPYWVVVFTNGQTDIVAQMPDEITIDRVSEMAIENGLVWLDDDGKILYKLNCEAYYYIAEVDAANGEMLDYRCMYNDDDADDDIDDFLSDKYGVDFGVKYNPE